MRFQSLLLVAVFFTSCREKAKVVPEAERASRHSREFNQEVETLLSDYYQLSESLVSWDTAAANARAATLIKSLDNARFEELKKDSLLQRQVTNKMGRVKNELNTLRAAADITDKRKAFNGATTGFFDLLKSVQYDRSTIYLEECTMPYNDTGSGIWLSRTNISDSIRNPYLGLHHPRYGRGMLTCSSVKDSVHFMHAK